MAASGFDVSPGAAPHPGTLTARGAARDALAGLRNLAELLNSRNIGPRSLAKVLPDVHASCRPMAGAIEALLDGLSESGCLGSSAAALSTYLQERVQGVEETLLTALRRPLNAKGRLELERAVRRGLPDLEGALALADLAISARQASRVRLECAELLRALPDPATAGSLATDRCEITLVGPYPRVSTLTSPQPALGVLRLALLRVARHHACRPTLSVTGDDHGRCVMRVSPDPRNGEHITIPTPPLVRPTAVCLPCICNELGVLLEEEPTTGGLTLIWPSADPRGARSG